MKEKAGWNAKDFAELEGQTVVDESVMNELRILRKALNRRSGVEQQLLYIAAGREPLPTREQCKDMAIRLGVPPEHREPVNENQETEETLP